MRIPGYRSLPVAPWVPFALAGVLASIGVLRSAIPSLWDPARTYSPWFSAAPPVIGYLLWALVSPWMYAAYRWLDPFRRSRVATTLLWIGFGLLVAALHTAVASGIFLIPYYFEDPANFAGLVEHFIPSMLVTSVSTLLELAAIVGVFFAFDFYNRFRQQQVEVAETRQQLSEAQLGALRMQLHPHFLFNGLHSVASLMEDNVADAQRVLSRLARLLRRMLEQDEQPQITLAQEVDYLRNYLDIERTRFKDRLTVRYDLEPDTLDALVPNLILQPLVENAVKHGFSRRVEAGRIELRSRIEDDLLVLEVRDDGRGLQDPAASDEASGIGLRNVRERLAHHYGERGRLTLSVPEEGRGCVARIQLPVERDAQAEAS